MKEKRMRGSMLFLIVALLFIFVFSALGFYNAGINSAVYASQQQEEMQGPIEIALNKLDEYGRPLTGAVFNLTLKNHDGEVVYEAKNKSVDEDGVLYISSGEGIVGMSNYLLTIEEVTVPKGHVKMKTETKTLMDWTIEGNTITK